MDDALLTMKTFYNGYRFSEWAEESLYNPTLSLYFLKHLQRYRRYPRPLLDQNLAMDRHRLAYVAGLPHGEDILIQALGDSDTLTIPELANRRPDMQRHQALDLVLELKYLSLEELNQNGAEIRAGSREDWLKHPRVRAKLAEASAQAERYGDTLRNRYGLSHIACFAVVALGLERLVYQCNHHGKKSSDQPPGTTG